MNFLQSVVLGLIQGLTEFIPVSSTGHLILAREFMGLDLTNTLSFDAILQLATGLAVLIYFWKDIWNIIKNRDYKLLSILVIASIPAVILGLFLEDYMDTVFRGTHVVAVALILGAVLFYFAERKFTGEISEVTPKRGFIVGLFQCLALIPGMSRSGSTISGGLLTGLGRETALRFSFILSLPIIFGSGLKKVWDLSATGALCQVESSLLWASVFAFLSGFLAIHFLLGFLKNHSLNWFGAYRILLAIIILLWL